MAEFMDCDVLDVELPGLAGGGPGVAIVEGHREADHLLTALVELNTGGGEGGACAEVCEADGVRA